MDYLITVCALLIAGGFVAGYYLNWRD